MVGGEEAWRPDNVFSLRWRNPPPDGGPPVVAVHYRALDAALRVAAVEQTMSGAAERIDHLQVPPAAGVYTAEVWLEDAAGKLGAPATAQLRFDATAPVTTLSGAPSGWSDRPVTLVASASDAASGMSVAAPAEPFTAIRLDGGAPVVAAGDSVRASAIAPGVHTVAYYARDAAGNVDDGHGANPPPATATVRIDLESPSVAFSGAQDPRDPERIEARVLDPLSGPSGWRGSIAVRRAGTGARFEPLATAVEANGLLRARWDSDAYPPGRYEFQATGYDRAGNESRARWRANGSPMVLPAPLKQRTTLIARLGPRRLLRGRLVLGRRASLAGMAVRVVERFAAGRGERVSTLRTDSNGAFALRLRSGPSREVVASFAGSATVSRAVAAPVGLRVRGRVRMRASAAVARVGGRPIVFRGRVAGAVPPGGKYVQLQFRAPGGRWTEFRALRSDARGRFRYAYRFSDDDSRGVRFRFRAHASAQDGWPYEPASSRPVVVRGR